MQRHLIWTKSRPRLEGTPVAWSRRRWTTSTSPSALVESGAISITDDAQKDIENFARIIVGMGPQSTLQRGFAIARDNEDKPLTSREAAMNHDSFQVQFRDGRVAVKNTDRFGRR